MPELYREGRPALLIANARVVTPGEVLNPGWVRVKDGKIIALWEGLPPQPPTIDAGGRWLLPGFYDPHIHGALGADVMDATPEALRTIARFCAQHGVTHFLPTTLTASHEDTLAALHNIRHVMEQGSGGAVILGAHLEGPYINPVKAGAQDTGHIRPPDAAELREYLDTGVIRIVSLAPELPGAGDLIDLCTEHGVNVSLAHTDASYEQARAAIRRGVRYSTHTFNAMRGFHHREPGVVGAVLEDVRVRCEVIADGVHVNPAAMNILWRMKRDGNGYALVRLITDAMRAAGMPDGEYTLGQHAVAVRDGRATLPDGTLAGSILTMPQALRNMQQMTGAPLPALAHLASRDGIRREAAADFVLLNDDFTVWKTIINGEVWQDTNA